MRVINIEYKAKDKILDKCCMMFNELYIDYYLGNVLVKQFDDAFDRVILNAYDGNRIHTFGKDE